MMKQTSNQHFPLQQEHTHTHIVNAPSHTPGILAVITEGREAKRAEVITQQTRDSENVAQSYYTNRRAFALHCQLTHSAPALE